MSAANNIELVTSLIETLDESGLARIGAAWFEAANELSSRDPAAAGRLASAMWAHLQNYRPIVSPALDDFEAVQIEAP